MKPILLTLLALLVVLAGAGWFYLDHVAQRVVERGGSRALGVPVQVDSMALSPFSGRLGIDGLRVANPEGFSAEPLFRLDRGAVQVRPASLFADVIEVPELTLDGLIVRLERKNAGTNLDRIVENLRGNNTGEDAGSGDAGADTGAASGQPTRLRIGYLRITGVGAQVDLGSELGERGRFSVDVPPIEMRDLGDDPDGLTVAALVERITRAVADEVEAAVARRVGRELKDAGKEAIESGKKQLEKRLRDEAEKLLGQ